MTPEPQNPRTLFDFPQSYPRTTPEPLRPARRALRRAEAGGAAGAALACRAPAELQGGIPVLQCLETSGGLKGEKLPESFGHGCWVLLFLMSRISEFAEVSELADLF